MRAAIVGVDWGTSSFRAYLVAGDGRVLERRETGDGILAIRDRAFAAHLEAAIGPWRARYGALPIVVSGMIGSRQGWVEAPYIACPAGLAEIAAGLLAVDACGLGSVHLVPGLVCDTGGGAPDVMRGEETQVLGALAAMTRAHSAARRLVLPGTHSKWVEVAGGTIHSFATCMTGEVYAALTGHTILARLLTAGEPDGRGFAAGVAAARVPGGPGSLLHRVFATRTLGLFDRLPGHELADYLSGLLIGAEILENAGETLDRTSPDATAGFTIVAGAGLAGRYARAGGLLGLACASAPADCVVAGHLALARAAGLLPAGGV